MMNQIRVLCAAGAFCAFASGCDFNTTTSTTVVTDGDGGVAERPLCPVGGGVSLHERACPGRTEVGECESGAQECVSTERGPEWAECEGEVPPKHEVCDGVDNDCDGEVDDELVGCEPPPPGMVCDLSAIEHCDRRDNNCNGAVDEGCECADDAERECGREIGECTTGAQNCVDGYWSLCSGTEAAAEVCDTEDNDCDGTVDEGCECTPGEARECGESRGECSFGSQGCNPDGNWDLCDGDPPASEECDRLDNDCDGDIDEGCPARSCVTGAERPCGLSLGECEPGTEVCNASGYWGACSGRDPASETCNGRDDNCDGVVDNGCPCRDGETRRCGTDVGLCESGTQACNEFGRWSDCAGAIGPDTETCDNFDNDCDGELDEGAFCDCVDGTVRACGSTLGQCTRGTQTCNIGYWDPCTGVAPNSEDCVDELDNDCDGAINEGCACTIGERRTCGSDMGECAAGEQACVRSGASGRWGDCVGAVTPDSERCDGLDNDCDGALDNGCGCVDGADRSCGTNLGECAEGRQRCVGGFWESCDPALGFIGPESETCDGRDNDCDGSLDEDCECVGFETRECGRFMGVCYVDVQFCFSGRWSLCFGDLGFPEICNGLDDDCDGEVDEVCECRRRDSRPCGETRGICTRGTQDCNSSGFWDNCTGTPPESEECNGLDDDCDGAVDEGLLNACGGCGPIPPELCDGLDNDCDGRVDEDCSCRNGAVRPCGTDIGICVSGTEQCVDGEWQACGGPGFVGPDAENCDSFDNNCNGFVDESCACVDGDEQPCGSDIGECTRGVQNCRGGRWGSCLFEIGPQPESCDGLDNDCDGEADESRHCDCLDGRVRECGMDVGACRPGTQRCVAGAWAACDAAAGFIGPDAEACDALDNDCDGAVDENAGCECVHGQNRPCGTDVGECVQGSQPCIGGIWQACGESYVGPASELCDGLDNNCDERIDEDCACRDGETQRCGSDVGECSRGTQLCSGGRFGDCLGEVGPAPEECDARDNNCDGQIDNGPFCECRHGESRECGTDMGECAVGVQQCVSGRWQPCGGPTFVGPVTEVCDARDNDCDSITDEDAGCRCRDGESRDCGTDVGECVSGTQSCVAGIWSDCAGDVGPDSEFCDLADNDCDGDVDEGCECVEDDLQPCDSDVGECVAGLQVCFGGRWSACFLAIGPEPELCDGLDNNCDGFIDNTPFCECRDGDVQTCGTDDGECAMGTQMCADGHWEPCGGPTFVGPATETCGDDRDNNCDGEADEGCVCNPDPLAPPVECVSGLPGICSRGTIRCEVGGRVARCVPTTFGPPETCGNGLDDDCDGRVDQVEVCGPTPCDPGSFRSCMLFVIGPCNLGREYCLDDGSGHTGICEPVPEPEICCNGIDEDCDLIADNGCVCP